MNRDFVAGSALFAAGAAYAIYAWTNLPIGSIRQMGAGFFPATLGILLAGLGVCIIVAGLASTEKIPSVKLRPLVAVICSVVLFAVLIRSIGLVAAVAATAICASFSLPQKNFKRTAILAAALVFTCWITFVVLLKQPIELWSAPF